MIDDLRRVCIYNEQATAARPHFIEFLARWIAYLSWRLLTGMNGLRSPVLMLAVVVASGSRLRGRIFSNFRRTGCLPILAPHRGYERALGTRAEAECSPPD